MQLKINRQRLYDACKKAMRAAATEKVAKAFPATAGILLDTDSDKETLKLYCTDRNISIMYKLENVEILQSGKAVVPASFFTSLLRAFEIPNCEDVAINVNKNIMLLQCGKAIAHFNTLESNSFPNVNLAFPDNTICVSNLSSIAKQTTKVAADINSRNPVYDCVKVKFTAEKTTAIATDTMRLIKASGMQIADGDLELLIPKKVLSLINTITKPTDELFVGTVGRKIVFMSNEFILSAQMIKDDNYNVEKIIKNISPVYRAEVDAKEFYDAVNLLISAVGDNDSCINVTLKSDSLHLFVHNENGESDIEIDAQNANPMNEKVFYYRPIYLYDFLKSCKGKVKLEFTESGILKLSNNLTDYIVSPRIAPRIKETKEEPKVKKPTKNKKGKAAKPAA